jgi:hypothetical protein
MEQLTNIPLARKVLEHIEHELGDDLFDMSDWGHQFTRLVYQRDEHGRFAQGSAEVQCGTSACIAGWACLLDPDTDVRFYDRGHQMYIVGNSVASRAMELLGLDDDRLFRGPNEDAIKRLRAAIQRAEAREAQNV